MVVGRMCTSAFKSNGKSENKLKGHFACLNYDYMSIFMHYIGEGKPTLPLRRCARTAEPWRQDMLPSSPCKEVRAESRVALNPCSARIRR